VTKSPPDPSIAPPLTALGGWADAAWFNASILTDDEVVGFHLPKLPGVRKQNFHVIDRSAGRGGKAAKGQAPAVAPRRLAGKLAVILDQVGATRAVACCRSKFLFESGAVLFFAEIPAARLKARPAAKFRRDLIGIGVRACVVLVEGGAVTAMAWARAETEISDFVHGAEPAFPLHAEFDKAALSPGAPAAKTGAADKRGAATERKLLAEIATLRQQVETLKRAQSELGAMEQLGLDDARLKSMLKLLHPDIHGGSEAATEAAKWINNLRGVLKEGRR
jgi:hypothetical protein